MFLDDYKNLFFNNQHKEENELKLQASVNYWCNALLEKTIRIFEWTGLPFPQREIEMRTLIHGFCGFVNDKKVGLRVASGSMSGVTQ